MNTMQKITLGIAAVLFVLTFITLGAAFASVGTAADGAAYDYVIPTPTMPALNDDDGDGWPNFADRCPETAGLAQWNGCPDEASYTDALNQ